MKRVPLDRIALAERNERIVDLSRRGQTAIEIGKAFGIHARTVERVRAKAGLAKRQPHSPLSDDEKRRIQLMLDDGMSYWQISKTIGRDPHTIKRHFPGYLYTKEQVAEAAALGRAMARLERKSLF